MGRKVSLTICDGNSCIDLTAKDHNYAREQLTSDMIKLKEIFSKYQPNYPDKEIRITLKGTVIEEFTIKEES